MSQGRPSQSPAGPSRLPVYLTGAPRLSSSSSSSMRSPRPSSSAPNRNGFKRSSAFQSFDAPAYCNDMAEYISAQLAIKPKRVSRRDQEIEAALVEDKWRGSSSQEARADLADVSVQTTIDDEGGSIFGPDRATEGLSDEIDISRTEIKKAEADAFLRQLQGQPEELTETEKALEEQVLHFFGADAMEQSSEKDELEESSEIQPEAALHIANMLAEKGKSVASGPLIEEVVRTEEEHQIISSTDSSDVEEDNDEESGESESSSDDEEDEEEASGSEDDDDERRLLSYEERRDALMRADAVEEEDNEAHDQMEEEEDEHMAYDNRDDGADVRLANGIDLYDDSPSAQPPAPFSETIELLDSDEEEEDGNQVDDGEEREVREEYERFANENDLNDAIELAYAATSSEANRPDIASGLTSKDLYDTAAMLDVGDEWSDGAAAQEEISVDDDGILEEDARLGLTQEIEAAASANLFEQPESAFVGYTDGSSSFGPMQAESVQVGSQDELTSTASPMQASLEEPAPPVLPHLRQAETGEDLASMKEDLASGMYDISQAPSLSVQAGTPQRAASVDQSIDTGDGHARHARDLFHIKSVAQRTLEDQASLATSLASDIDSAPHHSDVDGSAREQSVPEAVLTAQDEGTEASKDAELEVKDNTSAGDDNVLQDQGDDERGQDSIVDEMVEYVELAGSASDRSEEGQDIDIQSFTGSHSSEHIYGQEEDEVLEEPSSILVTILENEEEAEVPSPISRDEGEKEEEEQLVNSVSIDPVAEVRLIPEEETEKVVEDSIEEGSMAGGEVETEKLSKDESVDVLSSYSAQDLQDIAEQLAESAEQQEEVVDALEKTEEGDVNVLEGDKEEEEVPDAVLAEEQNAPIEEQEAPTEEHVADAEASTAISRPRRSTRSRTQTAESVSPTITKASLRKSQSRAPSEAAEPEEKVEAMPVVQEETTVKKAATPKRSRRSRTATAESSSKTPKRSLRSASRAISEAASEGSPRKHRHHHRKSDASGDLADFVPDGEELAEEEDEGRRPTKRAKVDKHKEAVEEEIEEKAEDADEEMLDTSILEEDDTQMQVDEQEEDPIEQKEDMLAEKAESLAEEEEAPAKGRKPRRRKSAPRKSGDAAFRVQKVEESDSDEDKEAKAKKDEMIKKRREADRERRQEQREAKKREKELQQKEEKEAERAAAGVVRKARISEDVKTYKPPVADEEGQEEEAEAPPPEETIAKRRSKRKAA